MAELKLDLQADTKKATSAIDNLISKLGDLSTALNGLNNVGKLSNLSQGISQLSASMAQFKQSGVNKSDFTRLSNSISTLTKINTKSIDKVGSSVVTLGTSLNSIQINNTQTVASISGLATAMAKLGAVNTSQFDANVPVTVTAINTLVASLNRVQSLKFDTAPLTKFISALSRLGSKSIADAPTRINQLTQAIVKMMQELEKAPVVSDQVVRMTEAISNIGRNSGRSARANATLTTSLHGLSGGMKSAKKSTQSLAVAFGKFYANCWLLIRGIKGLWKAIGSAMGTIETFNYFNESMKQIANKATEQMGDAGQKSAKEFYEQYTKEATDLTRKMSGYIVDEKGELQRGMDKNLGLDPNMLLNYQAQFAQLTNSMGVASDYSMKMQQAMSEISADLASVKNEEFTDVFDSMSSGLVGMSRAVDRFGVNIRNTALQERLADLGIETSITKLGQADKALLRSIVILDSTRYAWGDLADTLDQPANQSRMLQANFQSLSRTIGGIFLSAVNAVLPYINALVIALQRLAQYIINLFGITLPSVTKGAGAGLGDLASELYDDADAMDDATGSAKKLKNSLLGIDELNVLEEKGGGGGGAGSAIEATAQLQEAFDTIFAEYQEAWDKAYADVNNRAQEIADNIIDAFKSGDYEGIGNYISTNIAKQLKKINWNKVWDSAEGGGSGLAQFFNGLLDPQSFEVFGSTFANMINTKFHFIAGFVSNFDWINAGLSLASFVNGFAVSLDAKLIAKTISDAIKGALKLIYTFLTKTDFELVGKRIGEFIINVDWMGILKGIGDVILGAIGAILSTVGGIFNANVFAGGIVTTILSAVGGIMIADGVGKFVKSLNKMLEKAGVDKTLALPCKALGLKIAGLIGAGIITFELGNLISEWLYGIDLHEYVGDIVDFFSGQLAEDNHKVSKQNKSVNQLETFTKAKNVLMGRDDLIDQETMDSMNTMLNHLYEVQRAINECGYSWGDLYQAMEDGNNMAITVSDSELELYYAIYNNRDALDELTQKQLLANMGIETFVDGNKAYVSMGGAVGEMNDKIAENRQKTEAMWHEWENLPPVMQEGIKKAEKTIDSNWELSRTYGVITPKLREYLNTLGLSDDIINRVNFKTETQARAISATVDACQRYAEEQRRANGETVDAIDKYDDLAQSLADMNISSDELASYVETLSQTDLPQMTEKVGEMSNIVNQEMPKVVEKFESGSSQIRDSLNSVKLFMENQFIPMFSRDKFTQILNGVVPAFQNAFENATKAVVTIVNRMIDAINGAMNISWDAIEVNGEKVVQAGKAQLFKLDKIKGYALGGYPTAGDLFMANESGAEMIGSVNGRTAVVNNDQIVQSVSSGVRSAVAEVMLPYLSQIADNTRETANKDMSVNIGDRDIARANVRGQRSMGRTLISTT